MAGLSRIAVFALLATGCHARHQDFGFDPRTTGRPALTPVAAERAATASPAPAVSGPAAADPTTDRDTQRLVTRTKFESGRLTTATDYADGPLGPFTTGGSGPPAFSFVPPSPLEAGR